MLRHLISINDLSDKDINNIFAIVDKLKVKKYNLSQHNINIANLFYEESTRTSASFNMSAKLLQINNLTLNVAKSSVKKGETLIDTLNNLNYLNISTFIIRHNISQIFNIFKNTNIKYPYNIINAGDGHNEHPTQALSDLYTIKQHINNLENKNITIIGDIVHSRVAHSNIKLLSRYKCNITLIGPTRLIPYYLTNYPNVHITEKIKPYITKANIIMALRIQKERNITNDNLAYNANEYKQLYQVMQNNINKDTLIMHPGPINIDYELSPKLTHSQNSLIAVQVTNGLYIRMALLIYMNHINI